MLKWSSLGAIGNSSIAKMTILSPIIGTYILYNEKLKSYFIPKQLEATQVENISYIAFIHQNSFEFFYFGLILMGMATFSFQRLSPRQFQIALTPGEYAEIKQRHVSPAQIQHEIRELAAAISTPKSSAGTTESGKQLIHDIFTSIDFSSNDYSSVLPDLGRSLAKDGKADGELIARAALDDNPALLRTLSKESEIFRFDIFYSNFEIQNETHLLWRTIVSAMMTFSLLLLLLPSAATSILVLRGLL